MKNIVVLSLNEEKACFLAENLAKKLKFSYIDAGERFDDYLISSIDAPTILVDEILNLKESELLSDLAKENNAVIKVANDAFLSNENYKIFKNCIVVLVLTEKLGKTKRAIEEQIKKYSNVVVNENATEIEILKLIKSK